MNTDFKNKTVTVIGVGISNTPLISFLINAGARVTARDKKSRDKLLCADELEDKGVTLILGEDYLTGINEEYIFRTPGLRFDTPEIAQAVASGSVLTSEMELFFELCPAKIIGITGSDGKTTTTTVISLLIEKALGRVYVGGNIGTPLLPLVSEMTENDIAVVELSSFQLQTMKKSPDIAVVTNLSPNHLNYHLDMDEYICAKKNIFLHPNCKKLILNYKNDITRSFAKEAREGCEVEFFCNESGVYSDGENIYCRGEKILSCSDIILPGEHNIQNYMAAIAATEGIVSREIIRETASTFGGVSHRLELIREKDGVKFYNSSIDSSPARTTAALSSFNEKNVIIILGGRDKHVPFDTLREPLKRVAKKIILTGEAAPQIYAALVPVKRELAPIQSVKDFDEAVKAAASSAAFGDVVLLSPACTSFDAFSNFEERGNRFRTIINSL